MNSRRKKVSLFCRPHRLTNRAKVTGFSYKDHYINIVDTPGHADFGGEVERIMNMVDGVCLVVCACEGPMAQTKYVLKKAIQSGVKPMVIINKVDREGQRVKEVESELFDLFIELDENEQFVNYPVYHASAKAGWAVKAGEKFDPTAGVGTILDGIIEHISPPKVDTTTEKFSMLVSQIDYHPYFGRILRGKILSGEVKVGDVVDSVNQDQQTVEQFKVTKIYKPHYMENVEVPEAKTGDIIGITGMISSRIGDTLSTKGFGRVIPAVKIDPPMIMVEVTASNSPLAGQPGAISSFNDIVGILRKEADSDIALSCRFEATSVFVSGRGDLHLGVLFERLRRGGYEMEISAPMIITKKENGKVLDPLEQVTLEVDEKYVPQLMERILNRAGTVTEVMTDSNNPTKQMIIAEVFSKGLIGFRVEVANATNNTALYKSQFLRYDLCTSEPERQPKGAIVSTADGKTSLYGLRDVEKLGSLFVKGSQQVYEGMIIGESGKELDWDVNPTKLKELTNIRTHEKDEKVRLIPPREFSIEEAICYIRGKL
jgi:GTP-binding protein